jgi:hypothetical protein
LAELGQRRACCAERARARRAKKPRGGQSPPPPPSSAPLLPLAMGRRAGRALAHPAINATARDGAACATTSANRRKRAPAESAVPRNAAGGRAKEGASRGNSRSSKPRPRFFPGTRLRQDARARVAGDATRWTGAGSDAMG